MDELIETIEGEFYSFDVLQLVAVIEEVLEYNVNNKRIFFEVDADLSFPPSDVGYVGINTGDGGINNDDRVDNSAPNATVRLPVMNLLGSSSPLPIDFSDHITRSRPDADMYAAFLSILQNRLHTLWIDAQRKYSLWIGGGAVAKRIFESMTGLSIDKAGFFDFALAGLWPLSNRTRSAQGLKELLLTAFGDIPIYIEENVGRLAAVSNARPIGGGARLGKNATVGTRVYDKTSKFRVTVGPLDRETYMAFMPGERCHRLINDVVSVYLNEPVICEISVTCNLRDLPRARLGGGRSDGGNELGRSAVLGTNKNGAAIFNVRVC